MPMTGTCVPASACGGTRIRTLTSWPGFWIWPGSRRGCGCWMLAVATVSTCARWPGGQRARPGVIGRWGCLRTAVHPALLNADVCRVACPGRAPLTSCWRSTCSTTCLTGVAAVHELRRVLAPGGVCIAVTNGARHTRSLRALVERAVRVAAPGWRMHPATQAFTAENAAAQLAMAFDSITCVRPASEPPVVIRDATLAVDYVASLASHYQDEVARPWPEVVEDVRRGRAGRDRTVMAPSSPPATLPPSYAANSEARAASGHRVRNCGPVPQVVQIMIVAAP